MSKRNLSQATANVADKFFTPKPTEGSNNTNVVNDDNSTNITLDNIITNDTDNTNDNIDTNISNYANVTNDNNVTKHTHITQPTNKSKHYDTRGKRSERYGILLDKQLKEDLQLLCNATNNRSLNDFIVTVLLDYVEEPKNRERLNAYKELLKL